MWNYLKQEFNWTANLMLKILWCWAMQHIILKKCVCGIQHTLNGQYFGVWKAYFDEATPWGEYTCWIDRCKQIWNCLMCISVLNLDADVARDRIISKDFWTIDNTLMVIWRFGCNNVQV